MKKTAILPVITVIALAYAAITGHQISADIQNEVAEIGAVVISAGISVWGIFKNHKKEDNK